MRQPLCFGNDVRKGVAFFAEQRHIAHDHVFFVLILKEGSSIGKVDFYRDLYGIGHDFFGVVPFLCNSSGKCVDRGLLGSINTWGTVLLHKKVTAHIFALQLLIHFGILIAEKR